LLTINQFSKLTIQQSEFIVMIFLKILLAPFSFLYFLITAFRNHLFNIGYSRSFHFDTKVINVGNLSVGGTGKTPHVEYLIKLLKDKYKVATLSRGYGRKSKGFILADETSDALMIGDEPMQFYSKFS
jgi:tetraacyldisaccharide 4'-kinase